MKLKKYGKGGSYKMYEDGGPVKPKKKIMGPEKDLLLERMGMYDEPSKEEKREKEYLKKRAEAERQYRLAIKQGASEEQAVKIAEKYLRMYLKGGQVKLDANKDGKISGADFKMLRAKKK